MYQTLDDASQLPSKQFFCLYFNHLARCHSISSFGPLQLYNFYRLHTCFNKFLLILSLSSLTFGNFLMATERYLLFNKEEGRNQSIIEKIFPLLQYPIPCYNNCFPFSTKAIFEKVSISKFGHRNSNRDYL